MLKKIIFDVDDTLIMFNKNKIKDYKDVLTKYGFKNIEATKLYEKIDLYEIKYDHYDLNLMANFLTQELKVPITIDFLNELNDKIKNWYNEPSIDLINLLEFLKEKTSLYILTNYFKDVQQKRLENMGILKYFKKVYGGEECLKPQLGAFKRVVEPLKAEECLMIGDSLDKDIKPAMQLGLKVILFDPYIKYQNVSYPRVTNYKELAKMLEKYF